MDVIREYSVKASQSKHVGDQPFWIIQNESAEEKEARWHSGEVSFEALALFESRVQFCRNVKEQAAVLTTV